MIDYIKIEIPTYPRGKLLQNSLLDFKSDYSMSTGEIECNKIIAQYNGMKFISYSSEKLFVQGSIQKCYNFLAKNKAPNQITSEELKKGYNGNTFNLTQLKYAVNHLCDLLEINPNKATLRGFEYGLNINIDSGCQSFLNHLMLHKTKIFCTVKNTSQYYRQVEHQRFIIKCYDKQIQYGLKDAIIRFENKQKRMIDLKYTNINSLSDLTVKQNLTILKGLLLKKWDEVIMYDYTIHKEQLSKRDRNKIKDLKNPLYWDSMESNRTHRPRKKLSELSLYYGKNIHNSFKVKIKHQWEQQNKNCVTFNRLSETYNV